SSGPAAPAPPNPAPPKRMPPPAPKAPPPPPVRAVESDLKTQLVTVLGEMGLAFTADAVAHSAMTESANELSFLTPREFKLSMKEKDIDQALSRFGRKGLRVKIAFGDPGVQASPVPDKATPPDEDETSRRALADSQVRRFQQEFPDAQVRAVRNLKE